MYFPSKSEFVRLASSANLIPVTKRVLADFETPLSAYVKIRGHGESFLFESVEGGEHIGRYSFLGSNPRAVIIQYGNKVTVLENHRPVEEYEVTRRPDNHSDRQVRDGLVVVERILSKFRTVGVPGLPRFTGGAVGYLAYEFIHDVEPVVPRPEKDELGTPVLFFMIADELLVFDRVAQTLSVIVNASVGDDISPETAYEQAVSRIDRLLALLAEPTRHEPVSLPNPIPAIPVKSNVSPEQFKANVEKAKEYIFAGDIIQVVGSQRFTVPIRAKPLDVYRAARTINPSPYMFLLELDGFSLVGASPETHVRCEDRNVEIRPIAGTRPRGATDEEDKTLEKQLLNDPKERAEHVMLVDLARNDLGRVCEYGSVRVRDLMVIERYSHVMHIVSSVQGRLAPKCTAFDLMRATFPAGTLTGAPKIRAMQIIAELEGTQRGPYGGCVGYFSFNGNLDSCITIRTALIKGGNAYIQAGGGWVADSVPDTEFNESVNKSLAMIRAVAAAECFVR